MNLNMTEGLVVRCRSVFGALFLGVEAGQGVRPLIAPGVGSAQERRRSHPPTKGRFLHDRVLLPFDEKPQRL